MKKVSALLGIGLLGVILISFTGTHDCKDATQGERVAINTESYKSFAESMLAELDVNELHIKDIIVLEEEEVIDLGFDTAEYLPEGFNPYEGMVFDLDEIEYLEEEEEIVFDFDVEDYLPENFNALSK